MKFPCIDRKFKQPGEEFGENIINTQETKQKLNINSRENKRLYNKIITFITRLFVQRLQNHNDTNTKYFNFIGEMTDKSMHERS